jgi:preprotein translocase subunit YajC
MDLIFPLLILFMIGLVFMSSRQRKKQEQKQQSIQNGLAVGDVVVMTSGISGTVVDVEDERTIDVEIAPDVVTTWLRAAVREKLVPEEAAVDAEDLDEIDALPESSVRTGATPVVDAPGSTDPDRKDTPADTTDNVSSPRRS